MNRLAQRSSWVFPTGPAWIVPTAIVRRAIVLTCMASIGIASMGLASIGIASAEQTWPQWRGPSQDGVAPAGDYPVRWNESKGGEGIEWKRNVDGKGSSTPVVAGSVAYLTAGIDGHNTLIAIDIADGSVRWQTQLGSDRGNRHKKGGGSNPSPVLRGDHVYAYFRSGDLGCVDADGVVQWQTNLQEKFGEDTLWWDLGSSPMVTDAAVVVAVMQTSNSYLIAFDPASGDVLWKQDRNLDAPKEAAQSYITPLAVSIAGVVPGMVPETVPETVPGTAMDSGRETPAIAVMGGDHLTLHDTRDGRVIGKLGGFNPAGNENFRSISSPVADGNLIVCPYARGETVTCVRMDELVAGKGDQAIAWYRDDLGSDVPTPALADGRVYLVGDGKSSRGTVWCLDVETGETLWTVRLPKSRHSFSSSPLVAGNHLYATAEDNTTYVIGPLQSDAPELVATNTLADDEPFTVASMVPVDDALLVRTRNVLYRLGNR